MHTRFASVMVLLVLFATSALAQDISKAAPEPAAQAPVAPAYKLTGLVFGDYYLFAASHLPAWEDQHGLWLRRAYFTYDHTFSPTLTTRFRLEANSNGKLAGGNLTPFVKDAYLRWTFTGRQAVTVGIHPSLTFDFVESVWGLRHIEKTPLDLYRWDSSRDTGVTLSGPLNQSQTVKYAVQYGNESGNNAETDQFKGYRMAARYETSPGFSVEGMFGHFQRDRDADRTTGQLFAGYRAKRSRAGAQYSFQKRRAAAGSTASDVDLNIISAFGVVEFPAWKSSAFIRVDRYDDRCPDCSGIDYLPIDTTAPFTMTLAGLEYFLHPSVRVSPNFEWVTYGARPGGAAGRPEDDLALRLTFYWVW